MSNRIKHAKIVNLNDNMSSADKYKPKYIDTLLNSIPSVLQTLNPISDFLKIFTLIKSINIRATEYSNKYLVLNNDSFNNKIIR